MEKEPIIKPEKKQLEIEGIDSEQIREILKNYPSSFLECVNSIKQKKDEKSPISLTGEKGEVLTTSNYNPDTQKWDIVFWEASLGKDITSLLNHELSGIYYQNLKNKGGDEYEEFVGKIWERLMGKGAENRCETPFIEELLKKYNEKEDKDSELKEKLIEEYWKHIAGNFFSNPDSLHKNHIEDYTIVLNEIEKS